jgi:hypothetical protein
MKFAFAGMVSAIFAIIGTVAAPSASASPNDDFLGALARAGLSYPSSAAPQVIQAGQAVCHSWAAGKTYNDQVAAMVGRTGGNSGMAAEFIRAATSAYCPGYVSKIQ